MVEINKMCVILKSTPAKYEKMMRELVTPLFELFTMRKDNVASIVIHYKNTNNTSDKKHKFVLRLIGGIWLVDEKYFAFEDEKTWHSDSI